MKKIRMIASAVVVLSVVGSALAFETANRSTANVYCTDPAKNTCTIKAQPFVRTTGSIPAAKPCDGIHYGAFNASLPCPVNNAPVFQATE